jgi:hypothetical protein
MSDSCLRLDSPRSFSVSPLGTGPSLESVSQLGTEPYLEAGVPYLEAGVPYLEAGVPPQSPQSRDKNKATQIKTC